MNRVRGSATEGAVMMGLFDPFPLMILVVAAVLPVFRFTSLRVRNEAKPPAERDAQLGRKFVLGLFAHASLMMILVGLTVSTADVMWDSFEPMQDAAERRQADPNEPPPPPLAVAKPPKDWWNTQKRLAATLVLSGMLHGCLAWTVLYFVTNHRRHTQVGMSFIVFRFGLCGLLLLVANTVILWTFLAEGVTSYRTLSIFLSIVAVWGPTMIGHWVCMMWHSRRHV